MTLCNQLYHFRCWTTLWSTITWSCVHVPENTHTRINGVEKRSEKKIATANVPWIDSLLSDLVDIKSVSFKFTKRLLSSRLFDSPCNWLIFSSFCSRRHCCHYFFSIFSFSSKRSAIAKYFVVSHCCNPSLFCSFKEFSHNE